MVIWVCLRLCRFYVGFFDVLENAMKSRKGFTLIELMIVIAIIAIIAAIAIPNLMQSRIRANEATAVTVIKAYATAQVTWQVGRQGLVGGNTTAGGMGYASNFRNLHYGLPRGAAAGAKLELISQGHADAATVANDTYGPDTVGTPGLVGAYQGYFFQSPTGLVGVGGTADNPISWFSNDFAQLAIPSNSTSTGTNAYYVGQQGAVWMFGLPAGQALAANITAVGASDKCPVTPSVTGWTSL